MVKDFRFAFRHSTALFEMCGHCNQLSPQFGGIKLGLVHEFLRSYVVINAEFQKHAEKNCDGVWEIVELYVAEFVVNVIGFDLQDSNAAISRYQRWAFTRGADKFGLFRREPGRNREHTSLAARSGRRRSSFCPNEPT